MFKDFDNEFKNARAYALKLLSYSAKTNKEIRDRLNTRGFNSDTVTNVLLELNKAGYIDDNKIAEDIARITLIRKGRGKAAIKYTLHKRGVENDIIENIIDSISVEQEAQAALNYCTKRIKYSNDAEKLKIYEILRQRGFSEEAVEQTVKNL